MIEIASDRRTRDAYRTAHAERGRALRSLWKALIGADR